MKHLDLFSGIGGFALAARWVGWETVGFCEIDPYCQQVLRKHWPDVPIYEDVRELDGRTVGHVDIITGGYPCQPFSVAGKRRGEADDRHLWPEFARLIRELRPFVVVGENVAGHINLGLNDVLSDLEGLSYITEQFVIPACAVNAPHRRDRLWIVAHADSNRKSDGTKHEREISRRIRNAPDSNSERGRTEQEQRTKRESPAKPGNDGKEGTVANANSPGPQERPINPGMEEKTNGGIQGQAPPICGWWDAEPDVGRVANGLPRRVDRLRGLGNAIVPQVAEVIFRAIDSAYKQQERE